jgi:hypothetical protein
VNRQDRRFFLTLAFAVIVGLLVRWLALRGAHWRIDYDEGMVGLQVLRILRGDFPIFLPGQPYLGNLESYLSAPFFVLFGANEPTLKLVPLLLSGIYVATTGLIGRAAFDDRIGSLAALLAALAPVYLVVVGLKAWGATVESLVLGNLLLLITVSILQSKTQVWWRWALLGLIAGVAFWISWLITFYVLPVGIVLIWRVGRRLWPFAGISALTFLIGSALFWYYNLQYPFATFSFLLRGEHPNTLANIPRVLKHFVVDLVPRLVSGDPSWHLLDRPVVFALVAIYGLGVCALLFTRKRDDKYLLAVYAICFLPIYLLSGFGTTALNPNGIDATGRYVLMIHSVLPIGVALLTRYRVGIAAIALAIPLNLAGIAAINPIPAFTSPYYKDQPATLQPLIDLLDQRGIEYVWTDVGIAHVLMFETGERILAADYYDANYAQGLIRFPEVLKKVSEAKNVAYVELIRPGQTDTHIDEAFEQVGVEYERLTPSPEMLVIIPHAYVDPQSVLAGLGFQY